MTGFIHPLLASGPLQIIPGQAAYTTPVLILGLRLMALLIYLLFVLGVVAAAQDGVVVAVLVDLGGKT